jgi:hypothetical protein
VVVPCLTLVFLTAVRSFVTLVVLVEHTVQECTCSAVGNQVEETLAAQPCMSFVVLRGT